MTLDKFLTGFARFTHLGQIVCDLRRSYSHVVAPAAVVYFRESGLLLTRSCEWKLLHVM